MSRRSGGSSVHYTWDAQGSLAQRLDGAGAVLTSHLYDAFGAESTSGSTTDPYRYGGQWGYYTNGETGLCLLTHRYYDPGTGRFLNRDPIGYVGGVNVYGYVANSPLSRIDPLGTVAWREVPTTADEGWPRLYHHACIDFGRGVVTDCAGKSFGFWSQGVTTPDQARTNGDPFVIVRRDDHPRFEVALCKCIKESRRVGITMRPASPLALIGVHTIIADRGSKMCGDVPMTRRIPSVRSSVSFRRQEQR